MGTQYYSEQIYGKRDLKNSDWRHIDIKKRQKTNVTRAIYHTVEIGVACPSSKLFDWFCKHVSIGFGEIISTSYELTCSMRGCLDWEIGQFHLFRPNNNKG